MKESQPPKISKFGQNISKNINTRLQNNIFIKSDAPNTYYVPVYPRAYVQQIVSIDTDRKTISAKFVIMVTINLNVDDNEVLKEFIKNHLVLEFGYTQTIFIPQDIKIFNSPFLISKQETKQGKEEFVTYKIKGIIQCAAKFNLMFFPYRNIIIENIMTIRTQKFISEGVEYSIRYNALELVGENFEYSQFLPYFANDKFGAYKVQYGSSSVKIHENTHFIHQKKFEWQKKLLRDSVKQIQLQQLKEQCVKFHSYKHVNFGFQMSSMKLAYIIQQQTPIWALSIISLFLYHSPTSIQARFGNLILLIISYVAVIINFRLNNQAQSTLTTFEVKLMLLMSVPILQVISTNIDFYNPDQFNNRSNQIQNPFAYASLIVVLFMFLLTVVFHIYNYCVLRQKDHKNRQYLVLGYKKIEWNNLIELEWGQQDLLEQMAIFYKGGRDIFKIMNKQIQQKIQGQLEKHSEIKQHSLNYHSHLKPSQLEEEQFR